MRDIKEYSICKFLAIVLSILIAGQIHFAFSAQEETPEAKFKAAVTEYTNGNYGSARTILTGLTQAVEKNEQNKIFLGNTYLLLGASEEMLKENEAASAHYLKAKEFLGEREATIEGLSFSDLNIYHSVFSAKSAQDKAAAPKTQAVAAQPGSKKRSFLGKALGLVLIVGALGGLVWYLFFSPNAPLKSKSNSKGAYTSVTVQVDVSFRGRNTYKVNHVVNLDGQEKINGTMGHPEPFVWDGGNCGSEYCDRDATADSYSSTIDTDGKSLEIVLKYLDWQYWSLCGYDCCKLLCSDWTFTIVGYKWESGKQDPGSPGLEGYDVLGTNQGDVCSRIDQWFDQCTTKAVLTFKAPAEGQQADKVYTVRHSIWRKPSD